MIADALDCLRPFCRWDHPRLCWPPMAGGPNYSDPAVVRALTVVRFDTASDSPPWEHFTPPEGFQNNANLIEESVNVEWESSPDATPTATRHTAGTGRRWWSQQDLRWLQISRQPQGGPVEIMLGQERHLGDTRGRWALWPERAQAFAAAWQSMRQLIADASPTFAGVRYINRFVLPVPGNLEEYFRTVPQVSDGAPRRGVLSDFLMQLDMPQPDLHAHARLIQASTPRDHNRPDFYPVMLDIDVFRGGAISPDELTDTLEQLHDRENELFESTLTSAARDMMNLGQVSTNPQPWPVNDDAARPLH